MRTIQQRSINALKIDSSGSGETNECTLLIAPDLFCKSEDGFWNRFFLILHISIIVLFCLSVAKNLNSLCTKDDPLKLD